MATVSYTRTVATESALSDLQDLVTRVSRKYPALAERAMRASLLLASGNVHPLGNGLFGVRGADTYAVDAVGKTCSCPDFAEGGAPEIGDSRYCKHLLGAIMLTYLAERSVARESRARDFPALPVCVDCGVLCRCGAVPPRTVRVPLLARFQSA